VPNRLVDSNSPYLIQHANNPVDWFPWGAEALEAARQSDKPIFLSIGYAACHWCHVMAHESFEDPSTASYMNEHFINIKVDREERPDLDSIYMSAVVAMTGNGGWPMSVFLTPDGEPFYGGTYYPPARRYNMPSFREVLESIQRVWQEDRAQIVASGKKVRQYISQANDLPAGSAELRPDVLEKSALALGQAYDWKFGGWGSAPKFPQPQAIEFLLQRAAQGDTSARGIAMHALACMALGGMFDVVGGGFCRYSTDNYWLVPHFEKMLYDNAQLALAYLHGYLLTSNPDFRRVCEETLDFMVREMQHPLGGFYCSLDADSEGVEGKYYVWKSQEIRRALDDEGDFQFFAAAYTLTEAGNFEGSNVLQRKASDEELAGQFGLQASHVPARLHHLHQQLLALRQRRVPPATDDKILVSWNAFALRAFAEAARYLQRADYLEIAQKNAVFLLANLHPGDRLLRSWRRGKAQHNAYLEDYSALILGLLAVYQSDHNTRWYIASEMLTREMNDHFRDPQVGFFDTRDDHDSLITRPKDVQDNATPCGNSLAARALQQMAGYNGEATWLDAARQMLCAIQDTAVRYPSAFGNWLCAIDRNLADSKEVAILGDANLPNTQALLAVVWQAFRPHIILAASGLPLPPGAPPLLAGRVLINNLPTAYVCRNFTCLMPVNTASELLAQLDEQVFPHD
jgi:uncharacterized protein